MGKSCAGKFSRLPRITDADLSGNNSLDVKKINIRRVEHLGVADKVYSHDHQIQDKERARFPSMRWDSYLRQFPDDAVEIHRVDR